MKPTILLGESEPGVYTGSARSIPGVNIYEALNSQAKVYEKFGGHAGAAGLTIREEHLPQLIHRLNEFLKEHYDEEVFKPLKTYDLGVVYKRQVITQYLSHIIRISIRSLFSTNPNNSVSRTGIRSWTPLLYAALPCLSLKTIS